MSLALSSCAIGDFGTRAGNDLRSVRDLRAGAPVDEVLAAIFLDAVLEDRDVEGAGRTLRRDGVVGAVDRHCLNLDSARRDGVISRSVVDVASVTGDVPERLEPALTGDEDHFIVLGALEQAAEAAGEGLRPSVGRSLADVVEGETFLQDIELLGRQRQFHGSHDRRRVLTACAIDVESADCAPTTAATMPPPTCRSERRRVR